MIDSYIPSLPISLYIHIPFCKRKCDYCSFYSRSFSIEERDEFFLLLSKELKSVVEEIKKPFYSIYFGGGNPYNLGVKNISSLIDIASTYGKSTEVTVEVNPENVSDELEILFDKIDRLSLGIQSLNENALRTIGRNVDVDDNYRALEYLRKSNINYNADIITAIPSTSVSDTLRDIEIVNSYNPSHISFYCLTFDENTPLISRLAPMEGEKEALFLEEGWKRLRELGYEHYEISNFAKEGKKSLHNAQYWNLAQYIGIGPSAESFLGYKTGVTMRNQESIEEYLSSPSFNCERLNRVEVEESFLLTALRTSDGINKNKYFDRFEKSFDEIYSSRIYNIDKSFYINNENKFALTEKGMLFLDSIILTLSLSI